MKYLTYDEMLLIHSFIIDDIGGSHGIRDSHILKSLEDSPRQAVFGKKLYPTVYVKAALYARNIIMGHPFVDGNKRTGVTAASVFMENNGYIITAKKGEIEKLALTIVVDRLELEVIADWFKKHSKKTKK